MKCVLPLLAVAVGVSLVGFLLLSHSASSEGDVIQEGEGTQQARHRAALSESDPQTRHRAALSESDPPTAEVHREEEGRGATGPDDEEPRIEVVCVDFDGHLVEGAHVKFLQPDDLRSLKAKYGPRFHPSEAEVTLQGTTGQDGRTEILRPRGAPCVLFAYTNSLWGQAPYDRTLIVTLTLQKPREVRVQVVDQNGVGVARVPVAFARIGGNVAVESRRSTSDEGGFATIRHVDSFLASFSHAPECMVALDLPIAYPVWERVSLAELDESDKVPQLQMPPLGEVVFRVRDHFGDLVKEPCELRLSAQAQQPRFRNQGALVLEYRKDLVGGEAVIEAGIGLVFFPSLYIEGRNDRWEKVEILEDAGLKGPSFGGERVILDLNVVGPAIVVSGSIVRANETSGGAVQLRVQAIDRDVGSVRSLVIANLEEGESDLSVEVARKWPPERNIWIEVLELRGENAEPRLIRSEELGEFAADVEHVDLGVLPVGGQAQ